MNRNFFPFYLLFLFGSAFVHAASGGADVRPVEVENRSIQAIADEFRARLEISGQVTVQVVSQDKKLVSVHRSTERKDLFLLSFDQKFLNALTEDEIRAAIAHEFGHIWIFTHHPFLQTEALANRTALELVPKESLEKVYAKVTEFGGKRQEFGKP